LASALRQTPGVTVRVTPGTFKGEFTVLAAGALVAERCGPLPSITSILALLPGDVLAVT
jgi:hypothetical protein